MAETEDALTMVARKLHEAEARWMLTGSTAALIYGHQRTTVDIDVVIDMPTVDADTLVEAFQPEFFLDRQMVAESARTGTLFNALPLALGPKIDLIPLDRTDPLNELAFDTRELLEWGDMPVWVSSLPALVLNKLRWARDSGSERQPHSWGSRSSSTLHVPFDTTPDAAQRWDKHWRSLSGAARLRFMLDRCRQNRELQLLGIRRRNPGISYQDAVALWVQQQYGHELPPAFLERAMEAIRNYEPGESDTR